MDVYNKMKVQENIQIYPCTPNRQDIGDHMSYLVISDIIIDFIKRPQL